MKSFLLVFVGLCLGLLVAGGIYLLTTKIWNKEGLEFIRQDTNINYATESVNRPQEYGAPLQEESLLTPESDNDMRTFKSEKGFEFQYPAAWLIVDSSPKRLDNKKLVEIRNPKYAHKAESDLASESFSIYISNKQCKRKDDTSFAGRLAYDTGWKILELNDIAYRTICIPTSDLTIHIGAEVPGQVSTLVIDKIFDSFIFTK